MRSAPHRPVIDVAPQVGSLQLWAAGAIVPLGTSPLPAVSADHQGSLQSASLHRTIGAHSARRLSVIPVVHLLGVYRVLEWCEQARQLAADVQMV